MARQDELILERATARGIGASKFAQRDVAVSNLPTLRSALATSTATRSSLKERRESALKASELKSKGLVLSKFRAPRARGVGGGGGVPNFESVFEFNPNQAASVRKLFGNTGQVTALTPNNLSNALSERAIKLASANFTKRIGLVVPDGFRNSPQLQQLFQKFGPDRFELLSPQQGASSVSSLRASLGLGKPKAAKRGGLFPGLKNVKRKPRDNTAREELSTFRSLQNKFETARRGASPALLKQLQADLRLSRRLLNQ